jgi:transcriptional regulator with XRE-family HTH domain
MPRSRLSNYLRTERLRSGFTQRELGELFGVSRSVITKAEGTRPPPMELLLLTEIVFGSSQRQLLPGMYARLGRKLLIRALAMEQRLIGFDDPVSRRKCAFLGALIKRANAKSSQP